MRWLLGICSFLWHFSNVSDNPQAESRWALPWPWLACWLAVTTTLVVSAQHTSVVSQWHDDLGLIRTLGLWPLGGQGVLSAVLAQFTRLVPLGNLVFRAALVANVGAGMACLVFFHLLHRLLASNAHTPRLTVWLSMLGSMLLSLSTPMQRAATSAGGASVAVALGLGAIALYERAVLPSEPATSKRVQIALGALLVMAFFEQYWAAFIALFVIGVERALTRGRGGRVEARMTLFGALIAAAACSAPLLRMQRPHRLIPELPSLITSLGYSGNSPLAMTWGGVHWWNDSGLSLACAALLGALWCAAKPPLRARAFGWFGVLVVASGFGDPPVGVRESPVAALRVMAFAAVVVLATITAQTLALLLLRSRVTHLGGAVFVIPIAYFLLIAVHADEADIEATSAFWYGNDVFTQEAIWTLPRNSVLLLQSPEYAYRVWAERLAHGMRPDVLVVTPQQLGQRKGLNRLLESESAFAPLIRDWVLKGRPSEYVLSQLADVRPLFVELSPNWDVRVREHLSAWGLWSEFHSQTLGRSDRYSKMASTRVSVDRVIEVCKGSVPPDKSTLHLVALRLKEQTMVAASLGDRPGLAPLLEELDKTGAQHAFVVALRKLLDDKPHGPLDWTQLQAL